MSKNLEILAEIWSTFLYIIEEKLFWQNNNKNIYFSQYILIYYFG